MVGNSVQAWPGCTGQLGSWASSFSHSVAVHLLQNDAEFISPDPRSTRAPAVFNL